MAHSDGQRWPPDTFLPHLEKTLEKMRADPAQGLVKLCRSVAESREEGRAEGLSSDAHGRLSEALADKPLVLEEKLAHEQQRIEHLLRLGPSHADFGPKPTFWGSSACLGGSF